MAAHGIDMIMTKKFNFEVILAEKMGISRFSRVLLLLVLPYCLHWAAGHDNHCNYRKRHNSAHNENNKYKAELETTPARHMAYYDRRQASAYRRQYLRAF